MAKTLKVTRLAEDLAHCREKIAEVKQTMLAALEEDEARLETELLAELGTTGIGTLRVGGYNYIRAHKTSFKVSDPEQALEWAQQYPAVVKTAVDMTKASSLLQRELELPAGFERTDTEYLSVRKAAEDDITR